MGRICPIDLHGFSHWVVSSFRCTNLFACWSCSHYYSRHGTLTESTLLLDFHRVLFIADEQNFTRKRQLFMAISFTLHVHSEGLLAAGSTECLAVDDLVPKNKLYIRCLRITTQYLVVKFPTIFSIVKKSAFLLLLVISNLRNKCTLWFTVVPLYGEKKKSLTGDFDCFLPDQI